MTHKRVSRDKRHVRLGGKKPWLPAAVETASTGFGNFGFVKWRIRGSRMGEPLLRGDSFKFHGPCLFALPLIPRLP